MKHYQALMQILNQIFGLPIVFSRDGHNTPKGGEILVLKMSRTMDEEAQKQLFSGRIAALVQDIDLLEQTRLITGLGYWNKTVERIQDYEVLSFSDLTVPDASPQTIIEYR